MRPLLAAVTVAAVATTGTVAEAGRGFTGTKETLMFVAETSLSGVDSDTFALCHLVRQHTAFGIVPLTYSVESYALADFGCETSSYIPLTAPQIATLRDEGRIPAGIPDLPALPLRYTAQTWGVWAVILGLLAAMLTGRLPIAPERAGVSRRRGRATAPFELRLVEAMMLTACADGHLDDRELDLMARAVAKITGKDVSRDTVRHLAAEATPPGTAAEFHDFGVGLSDQQRIEVLRAALAIAVADGRIAARERAFLDQLALGLMIPVTAIDAMLQKAGLAGVSAPSPAAAIPA